MAELLTRSDIPIYDFELGSIYTQQLPTYDEIVAADNAGKKLFIFDGNNYLDPSIDLHLYGHKVSNYSDSLGYSFSEAVGEYLYRGRVFDGSSVSLSEDWMYYGGFKFENYANGTSAITAYNYASNDKYAENIAVYNYTTGHTMPKSLYYPYGTQSQNSLHFCNGIIYAGSSTAGRSTTAWTISFSTFYDLYMGSMGALSITETGDSSDNQTMFNNLKPQIMKHLKFYKSGGGGTTLMNISWNTFSSTQMIGKYGGANPAVYIEINIISSTPHAYITMTT